MRKNLLTRKSSTGIYHRFTCDSGHIIHVMRLFVGEPVWTPFNRPCDEHPSRQKYVELSTNENWGLDQVA